MTDVQDGGQTAEPSMEEILASIRRIIADEKDPATAAALVPSEEPKEEEVLTLTQEVKDDGAAAEVAAEAPPAPPPPPPADLEIEMAPIEQQTEKPLDDTLVSSEAANAAQSSLAALASTVQAESRVVFGGHTLIGDSHKTLEDIVMALLKPILKDWLDQNLPTVVERIVQKEVERIARRAE